MFCAAVRHLNLSLAARFSTAAALCLLLLSTTAGAGVTPRLMVRSFESRATLLDLPVSYGQDITIRYVHSVDRSPVFEVFTATREYGLVLKETYFRMFGAGMGHWQGHGRVVQADGWIRIVDINRPIGPFVLRIGSAGVDHTLISTDWEINLSGIAPGRRVEIFLSAP